MNIEEQVLSREQMAHLAELGVDTSDASMVWVNRKSKIGGDSYYLYPNTQITRDMLEISDDISYYFKPTYTIGDLIEKLPKDLLSFSFSLLYEHDKIGYYETSYGNIDTHHEEDLSNNPILGLYKMLCWVAENHKELIK